MYTYDWVQHVPGGLAPAPSGRHSACSQKFQTMGQMRQSERRGVSVATAVSMVGCLRICTESLVIIGMSMFNSGSSMSSKYWFALQWVVCVGCNVGCM